MPDVDIYAMSAKHQAIIHLFATKGCHTWLEAEESLRYACRDAISDLRALGILTTEGKKTAGKLRQYKITQKGLKEYKQFLRRQHSVLAGAPADVQELISDVTPRTYHSSIFSDFEFKPFIPPRGAASMAAFSVPSRGVAC